MLSYLSVRNIVLIEELKLDANWLLGRDVSPEWPKDDPLIAINDKLDRALNDKKV